MRVETLTPVVAAAPGARAHWRLRVENDHQATVGYRLRIIGFDPSHVVPRPPTPPLPPGTSEDLDVELVIPEAFAAGHHSIAVEVVPDRPGAAPVIAAVTVSVGTIDDVALAVVPSTIRARRRARFRVDIDNRSNRPVELELTGEGPELEVRMEPDRVALRPGERVRTSGRVKGPRHLIGDPLQHSLTVAARSRSAPAYAPATFQQRSLLPRGLRTLVALLLIVSIWGGALGAGFLWWQARDDGEEHAAPGLVDTDGDHVPDTPAHQLVDTDGDGVPDTAAAVVAERVAETAGQTPPQAGGSDLPTRTSMGGTVEAGDGGQATGVDVTLTPIDLGAPMPERASPLGFANAGVDRGGRGKLWPARFGRYDPVIRSGIRQTETVADQTTTDERGVWFFGGVSIGQSYEVSFSRPGYDTQAFVVTPTADGKPIDLPVELEPASGAVRGSVTGPNGPLGNVELVLTDGTLVFNSASASSDDPGTFAFTGVSTPGTYSLLATAPGLGTEVVQVTLEAGEQRGGVDIRMRTGVGSVSGRVTEGGQPLGGVTLSASNGDTTVETTSLTEGATGSYLFPRLDIPGRYTITAEREGYVTQTRVVNLTGNATGVDFDFVHENGTIVGLAESSNGGGLPGANVRVSHDDLVFETQTAVAPDAGAFTVAELPPGTYLVELSRYDHEPYSISVTVGAGQVVDLGRIVVPFRPRPDIAQNASLTVRVVDSQAEPLGGATVRVLRHADDTVVAEQVGAPDQTSFVFQPMLIGTYRVEVTKGEIYRLSSRQISIGLRDTETVIPLYRLGQVVGSVVDSVTGEYLTDYAVQIWRVLPNNQLDPDPVQNIAVTEGLFPRDPVTGVVRWESAAASLNTGTYEVRISSPPPGYSVTPDQVLVDGHAPMRFTVSPTDDAPIQLRPIEADRFPELSGAVFAPQLANGTVTFAPIDRADLVVALTCPGVDGVDQTLTLTGPPVAAPPNTGLSDTPGSNAGVDRYFIGPDSLQQNDLFGLCTMTFSAGGYVSRTFEVVVSAGDGTVSPVLFRNVALFRPETIGGDLYWVDEGVDEGSDDREPPATGVNVAVQGEVIVGMTPGTVPVDSTGSDPTLVRSALSPVTSNDDGFWAYVDPKQVFGEGFYTFTAPGRFELRRISLTINGDEDDNKTAAGEEPAGEPPAINDDGSRIELDAVGGPITAVLDVRTIKGSSRSPTPVDLSGFEAHLEGANEGDAAFSLGGINFGQLQSAVAPFETPDPGTHRWTVTPPETPAGERPRFVPVDGADAPSAPFFQEPGQSVVASPELPQLRKTYAEMGAMDLFVRDSQGNAIPNVSGTLTPTDGGAAIGFTTGADGNASVTGLPVSTDLNGTGTFVVALAASDELDLDDAHFTVSNDGGPNIDCMRNGCAAVVVAQGGQPDVTVRVPQFGTLTGQVFGNDGTGTRIPLLPPDLAVTARRVASADCVELPTPEPVRQAVAVDTDNDGDVDSFRFSGPPGLYELTFEHPDYQSTPVDGPPQQAQDVCMIPGFPGPIPNPNLTGFVYRLQNDVNRTLSEPFFTLLILPSDLTIEVRNDTLDPGQDEVTDESTGDPVPEAQVVVTRVTGPSEPEPTPITILTDDNGRAVFAGTSSLTPGPYSVDVTKTDPTGAVQYFPVGFDIFIPPGGAPVSIDVPVPRVGGRITGQILGENSEGNPIAAPVGVVVSDSYDADDPESSSVTITSVDGQEQPLSVIAEAADDPDVAPRERTTATYRFEGLGTGAHELSYAYADPEGWYTDTPANQTVEIFAPVPVTADPVVFTAANRQVVVEVRPASAAAVVTGAQVSLVDPDDPENPGPGLTVGACPTRPAPLPAPAAGAQCAVIDEVPPELAAYGVQVSKELFGTETATFDVDPGNPAVPIVVPVIISGTTARITGTVTAQNSGTQDGALSDATISLYRVGQAEPIEDQPSTNGAFSFDITSPGDYEIGASADDFAPRRIRIGIGSAPDDVADLGEAYAVPDGDLKLPRLATFSVGAQSGVPGSSLYLVSATVVSGAQTIAPTAEVNGGRLEIKVDPGVGAPAPPTQPTYRFRIGSTAGYRPGDTATTTAINPGATRNASVTLPARTVSGTVSGGPGARVRLVDAEGDVIAEDLTITGNDQFSVPGPIPEGEYTLIGEELGTGRGTRNVSIEDDADADETGVNVSLSPRPVRVTFASDPPNASIEITTADGRVVTGTGGTAIDVPEDEFPIDYVAAAPGRTPRTGTAQLAVEEDPDDRWDAESLTMTVDVEPLPTTTTTTTTTVPPTTTTTTTAPLPTTTTATATTTTTSPP